MKAFLLKLITHTLTTLITIALTALLVNLGNVRERATTRLHFTGTHSYNAIQITPSHNGTLWYAMRQIQGTPGNTAGSTRYDAIRRNSNARTWSILRSAGFFSSNNTWIGPFNGGVSTRNITVDFGLRRTRGAGTSVVELQVGNRW